MAPMRLMRAATPGMAERGWGRVVNVSSTAGKRPSQQHGRVLGREGRRSSRSRASTPTASRAPGVLVNAVCPGPVKSEMWMAPGGPARPDRSTLHGHDDRDDGARGGRSQAADRTPRRGRRDRLGDRFLCSERASYVARRRLERRRRHRPGDHLSAPGRAGATSRGPSSTPPRRRRSSAHGSKSAAVLVPLYGWPERPGSDLHRAPPRPAPPRRRDLVPRRPRRPRRDARRVRAARGARGDRPRPRRRRGRRRPAADVDRRHLLQGPAGRRARSRAARAHAQPPRGRARDRARPRRSSASRYGMRRLIRRGVPFRTPTFDVEDAFIWGATARMLAAVLRASRRLPPSASASSAPASAGRRSSSAGRGPCRRRDRPGSRACSDRARGSRIRCNRSART